jgi:hypothetical protein
VPIFYERDDTKRRITATSVGRVTLEQTIAIIDRQALEGAWSYGTLYDARASDDVPTAAEVQQLVQHIGVLTTRRGPRGPVALVVGKPALSRMGTMYAKLAELTALDARVFVAVEEAERWLDERS